MASSGSGPGSVSLSVPSSTVLQQQQQQQKHKEEEEKENPAVHEFFVAEGQTTESNKKGSSMQFLDEAKVQTQKKGFNYGIESPTTYFHKWKGKKFNGSAPLVNLWVIWWSWFASFCGILVLAILHEYVFVPRKTPLLIGSFGASAVLLYAAPYSHLAQPRSLLGGHVICAICGIIANYIPVFWLAASLAVSWGIAAMHLTKTTHPPGAATALIAVLNQDNDIGWIYLLMVFLGALLMLLVAIVIDNIPKYQRYPQFWV